MEFNISFLINYQLLPIYISLILRKDILIILKKPSKKLIEFYQFYFEFFYQFYFNIYNAYYFEEDDDDDNKIRVELCCRTYNVDIPIYHKKEMLRSIVEIKIDKLLDEISNESGIEIKAKEVGISDYPQYYLNEKQLKKYNDFFEEEEQEEI